MAMHCARALNARRSSILKCIWQLVGRATQRGPTLSEETYAESLQLLTPEEIPANRVSQFSVMERAADFLSSLRRQASLKTGFEEREIQFGGRVLLIGCTGTDFDTFVNHLSVELPTNVVRFRESQVGGDSGNSAELVRVGFEFARRNAPCLFYVGRLDLIERGSAPRTGVLQTELERTSWDTDSVIVVAATVRPDYVDGSVLATFDRSYLFESATSNDRVKVLEHILKGREDIDPSMVAELTDGWSFADIKHLAVSLYMIDNPERGQITQEKLEALIKNSGVLPLGKKGYVELTTQNLGSQKTPKLEQLEHAYPDAFLDQLYLMAVGDDFAGVQRVIESLNAGLPLSSVDRQFITRYPFLLTGTPEDRLTRLVRAKKSYDRLARIMGR